MFQTHSVISSTKIITKSSFFQSVIAHYSYKILNVFDICVVVQKM